MIEKEIEEFKKYINQFDMTDEGILIKYNHTNRVVAYADKITSDVDDLNLKRLSLVGALLHDISRFMQWSKYNTFEDYLTFDHGDMGYELLKNNNYISHYVKDDYEKEVILNAVRQHNKKNLILTGDYTTDYVARVVKDADMLDIIKNQYNGDDMNSKVLNVNGSHDGLVINSKIINSVLNKELCNNKDAITYFDEVVREIAFIFGINFKESFKIIDKENYIDIKMQVLRNNDFKKEYVDIINKIEKTLKDFLNEKIRED